MKTQFQTYTQSLSGKPLDELIAKLTLRALEPAALEISLKVAEDLQAERQRHCAHWERRLERARYDAERARRQYDAVEPENRLVARTLERQWEEALAAQEQLNIDYARFRAAEPATITREERQAIQKLAADIPRLWNADTTTDADRQAIVRQLVERIIITVVDDTEQVNVEVHWAGGHQTRTRMTRPVARLDQLSNYAELMARITQLRSEELSPAIIARTLNEEGWRPPKRRSTFNASMIRSVLVRQGCGTGTPKQRLSEKIRRRAHEWTFSELGRKLDMPTVTLYSWLRRGWLRGRLVEHQGRKLWLIRANDKELERLRQQRLESLRSHRDLAPIPQKHS